MLLADLGAEVIRLDKSSTHGNHNKADIHNRNKKSITVDLKNPESIKEVKKLIAQIDVVFEGFRPGVMEKLGLGPEDLRTHWIVWSTWRNDWLGSRGPYVIAIWT